jgi:hypothetical protein
VVQVLARGARNAEIAEKLPFSHLLQINGGSRL